MSNQSEKLQIAARMGEQLLKENSKLREQVKTLKEANESLQFERDAAQQDAERTFGHKLKTQGAYLIEAEQKIEELTNALDKSIESEQKIEELTHALEKSIAANEANKSGAESPTVTPKKDWPWFLQDNHAKKEEEEELPQTPTSPLKRQTSYFDHRRSTRTMSLQQRGESDSGAEEEGPQSPGDLVRCRRNTEGSSQSSMSSLSSSSPENSAAVEKAKANATLIMSLRKEIASLKQKITICNEERKQEGLQQDDMLSDLSERQEEQLTELYAQIELLNEKALAAEQRAAAAEETLAESSINQSNEPSTIGDELVRALTSTMRDPQATQAAIAEVEAMQLVAKLRTLSAQQAVTDAESDVHKHEKALAKLTAGTAFTTSGIYGNDDEENDTGTVTEQVKALEVLLSESTIRLADAEAALDQQRPKRSNSLAEPEEAHMDGIADIIKEDALKETGEGDAPEETEVGMDDTEASRVDVTMGDTPEEVDIVSGDAPDLVGTTEDDAPRTPRRASRSSQDSRSSARRDSRSSQRRGSRSSARRGSRSSRRRSSVSSSTSSGIKMQGTLPTKRRSIKPRRRSSLVSVEGGGVMLVLTRLLFPETSRVSPNTKLIKAHQMNLKEGIKMHSPTKEPFSFL